MRNQRAKSPAMSSDAYAGFLKLLLTPASQVPRMSPDLEAYLRYVNDRDPVSADVLSAATPAPRQAA
jgi:hypothetical protein